MHQTSPRHSRNHALAASRPPWAWAGGGAIFGLLLAALVFAPARWLAQGLAYASAQRVQLVATQGTVWDGSAQLLLSAGSSSQTQAALPGRVHWQLRPDLQGLTLALGADCCLAHHWVWTVRPSLTRIQILASDTLPANASHWPAALFAGLGTPWNTLQLTGDLALSSDKLALQWQPEGWTVSGRVQLEAQHLSTSLSTLKPVGSYRLVFIGGAAPTLDLSTLEGSLQLTGTGHWEGAHLRFDGQASASPERSDALANLLNIIGRREGARSIIKIG